MTNQKQNTKPMETTLSIGHISTGKIFIISLYDKKGGKMITSSPFNQKIGTDFYGYSHTYDMREGKDIETLQKRFPTLKTYSELSQEHKGLTETSYTQLIIWELYNLIKTGQMDLKGTNKEGTQIHLKINWTGEELQKPTPKTKKETTPKNKQKKEDLLDGLKY